MMTKNAPFLIIIFLIAILSACDTNTDGNQEIALSRSEASKRMVAVMVTEAEKNRLIIKQHYNELNPSIRDKMTLRQYHLRLLKKYSEINDKRLNALNKFDRNQDPKSQMNETNERLEKVSDIPQWYLSMKKSTLEKVIKAGRKRY